MTRAPRRAPAQPDPASPDRSGSTARLLAEAARTGDDVRKQELWDEAVTSNFRVARALARRFPGRGIDREDLEQVAFEGLIKAVQRFDPSSEHDFMSFAVPTIRGEIQRHFRDLGWMVRPTRWTRCHPVPDRTGVMSCRRTTRRWPCEARAIVLPAVRALTERERRVIYLRFFDQQTQHEIADEIGVGQAQVLRILVRVLGVMHDRLTGAESLDEPWRRARAS